MMTTRALCLRRIVGTNASSLQNSAQGSSGVRCFSSNYEWRKKQLEKIERKFGAVGWDGVYLDPPKIDDEDELQPMWKGMESRVKNRRPRTRAETGGKTGRTNIKKTDEEMWLKEGLYDENKHKDKP